VNPETINIEIQSLDGWRDMEPVISQLDFTDTSYMVTVQAASNGKTSLDYKAVFWIWMRHLAKSFTERGRDTRPQEMHDLMCHRFLGYTGKRKIGNTELQPAMKTITYPSNLTLPDFHHFLSQIEEWGAEVGAPVPVDPNSDYERAKQKSLS